MFDPKRDAQGTWSTHGKPPTAHQPHGVASPGEDQAGYTVRRREEFAAATPDLRPQGRGFGWGWLIAIVLFLIAIGYGVTQVLNVLGMNPNM
jgi:hypothetical protein